MRTCAKETFSRATCQAHAIRDQLLAHDFDGSVKLGNNLGT